MKKVQAQKKSTTAKADRASSNPTQETKKSKPFITKAELAEETARTKSRQKDVAKASKVTPISQPTATPIGDLYAQAVEMLTAKPDMELNVLAGRLKTNIGTANQLMRQFKSTIRTTTAMNPHNGNVTANSPSRATVVDQKLSKRAQLQSKMAAAHHGANGAATVLPVAAVVEVNAVVATPDLLDASEHDPKVEHLGNLSSKVSRKKASVPKPSGGVHDTLVKAGYHFVQTATPDNPDGDYIHGYQHKDGSVAAYSFTLDDRRVAHLTVQLTDGTQLVDDKALRRLSMTKQQIFAEERAVKRIQRETQKAAEVVADSETYADVLQAQKPKPIVPELIAGVPSHVVRAIELLGGLTLQRFDLDLLRGDKYYGKRMSLLKKLFNRERILAKECGITNLVEAFYSAVGVGDGRSAAAKSTEFTKRCKEIASKVRTAKAAVTRIEKQQIEAARRASVIDRTVPGRVLDGGRPLSKKERAAQDAADRAKGVLAVSEGQHPVPKPDAEVKIEASAIHLLEDPSNGIVMMQLERENSQGAICVYNNGSRVAAGVIPPEVFKTLRPVSGQVDVLKAARQLLNPIVPSVPVTPVAARHLTAVLHCKELVMATATAEVSKSAKFAPPTKKGAAAAKKAAEKPEKKAKAAKADKGEGIGHSRIAGKKIKVVSKEPGAREGSNRFEAFAIIRQHKLVDDALKALDKKGYTAGKIHAAIQLGLIEVVD